MRPRGAAALHELEVFRITGAVTSKTQIHVQRIGGRGDADVAYTEQQEAHAGARGAAIRPAGVGWWRRGRVGRRRHGTLVSGRGGRSGWRRGGHHAGLRGRCRGPGQPRPKGGRAERRRPREKQRGGTGAARADERPPWGRGRGPARIHPNTRPQSASRRTTRTIRSHTPVPPTLVNGLSRTPIDFELDKPLWSKPRRHRAGAATERSAGDGKTHRSA